MHGEYKVPRGKLVVIDLETDDDRLHDVRLSGDFFIYPDEASEAIVAALEGAPAGLPAYRYALRVADTVPPGTELFGLSPAAVGIAVTRAQELSIDA